MASASNFLDGITATGTTAAGGYQLPGNVLSAVVSTCTSAAYGLTLGQNIGARLLLEPYVYEVNNDGVSALTVFFPTNTTCLVNGVASCVVPSGYSATFGFKSSAVGYVRKMTLSQPLTVRTAMVALAGGGQPANAANIILPSDTTVMIGTCATAADSVGLPAVPNLNTTYTIYNGGAAAAAVYPGLAAGTSTINNLAANIPVYIGVGASRQFMAVLNAAGVISWTAYGYWGPEPVIPMPVGAGLNLNGGYSGCLCTIGAITNNRTYTLPALATSLGMHIRFQFVAAAAGGFVPTIDGPAGSISGVASTPGASVVTDAKKTIIKAAANSIVGTANNLIGDYVDCYCDGTRWVIRAVSIYNAGDNAAWA